MELSRLERPRLSFLIGSAWSPRVPFPNSIANLSCERTLSRPPHSTPSPPPPSFTMASTQTVDQPAEVASKVLRRAQVSKVRSPSAAVPAGEASGLDANMAGLDR